MTIKPKEGGTGHKSDVPCHFYLQLISYSLLKKPYKDTMNGLRQVKVLVNRDDWEDMILLNKVTLRRSFRTNLIKTNEGR